MDGNEKPGGETPGEPIGKEPLMSTTNTSTATRSTYWYKPGRWANSNFFARCDSNLDREIAESEGYYRVSRADFLGQLRWQNGENAAWGSGRAFGDEHIAPYIDRNHPEYPSRSMSAIAANGY